MADGDWLATCAELRRQLAGMNGLLADAERERDTARAQRQAIHKRLHKAPRHAPSPDYMRLVADIDALLGVTGDDTAQT